MRARGRSYGIPKRRSMCARTWVPRPRSSRPRLARCSDHASIAMTIGLRANAIAMPVPRRSDRVCVAATASESSGSTWVSAIQTPWKPFRSRVAAYSPARSISSVVTNASSFTSGAVWSGEPLGREEADRVRAVAEVQTCDLHALPFDVREAVEDAIGVVDDVDRKPRERVSLGFRLEPQQHVALDRELGRERWLEARCPRSGRDDEVGGVVLTARGVDANALERRFPGLDRLLESQRRAVPLREREVRFHAPLRRE